MQDSTRTPVLELRSLVRTFRQGERELQVLDGASCALFQGEAVALVGPSGAGKSTLLHIAGLLESPDGGHVFVDGRDCARMNDEERTFVRRRKMGFVYQFHQLLPEFSALENVALPQMIKGMSRRAAEAHARELLTGLGLGARLDHRPAELSGGEQQRTAIARALANSPRLLLADEPTGNLDPHTSEGVFAELLALIERERIAALIATHNMDLARRMHRVMLMREGRLWELNPHDLR
ncbi:MAG: ABC transporter ATP-binding protein [Hyphomicrobiaceae bacterium]